MITFEAKTNNEGMNQYEKNFYKLLVEQQLLIEQEKLLGDIEELKKKNYTRRLNMKLKKKRGKIVIIKKNKVRDFRRY